MKVGSEHSGVSSPSSTAQRNNPWKHLESKGADTLSRESFAGMFEVRRVKEETATFRQDKINSLTPLSSPLPSPPTRKTSAYK